MASKVNTKVVVLIAVGALVVLGGTVALYSMVGKNAADHIRAGDAAMARGDYEKASFAYSKAAHKEPNNLEGLAKWSDSLSRQTPTSIQAYTDRYREWFDAERSIAQVKRTDAAAYAKLLDMTLWRARAGGRSSKSDWQALLTQADTYLRQFPESDKQRGVIRRYRGIAVVGKIGTGLEVSDADRKAAQADLEAALELNPSDGMAVSTWSSLRRAMATRLNQTNQQEEAEKVLAATQARLAEFVELNPTSTSGRLALIDMEISALAADARAAGTTQEQFQAILAPKLEALITAVETDDPKTTDEFTSVQILEMAAGNQHPRAYERGVAALDRLLAARGNDPTLLLTKVTFHQKTGHAREAVDLCRQIIALPNLPISNAGIMLFHVRDQAAVMLVDNLLVLWNNATDPKERETLLAEARQARDDVKARANVDDAAKLFADAKIAVAANDSAEARKLLGQYNTLTNHGNPEALAMAAEILQRQQLYGAARDMLRRIVEMRRATPQLYMRLVEIELALHNYPSALSSAEAGLAIAPGHPRLTELRKKIDDLIGGDNSPDPMVRKQTLAERLINSTPPDIEGAMRALQEAAALARDDRQLANLALVMARVNRRADAVALVEKGLRSFPDSAVLKNLAQNLAVGDPLPGILKSIEESDASPLDKAVQRYVLWVQRGDHAQANAALDAAFALNPEHAVVVAGMFERHLSAAAFTKAEEMAKKAAAKDLDKVEGRFYKARLMAAQSRYSEAVILLQQATEIDPSNPLTWRFLGQCYMMTGDSVKGLRAIGRAESIRPEDPQTIIIHVQALVKIGQELEALNRARDALRFGISEPAFVDLWLDLEFEQGDKDKAIDRRKTIFERQPDNLRNATSLATILLRSKRVDDAERVVAALEGMQKPELADQLSLLKAALKGARGDTPAAVAGFDATVAGMETRLKAGGQKLDGAVHLEFARLMNALDNTELALAVLEKGRAYQDPRDAQIDRVLGDTYFAIQKWPEARAAYQRALDSIPEDIDHLLLKRVIECSMRDHQLAEAEALLNKLGGANSKDQQILLLLAQLAGAANDNGRARELLNKAVQLDPQGAVGFRQRALFNAGDPRMIGEVGLDLAQAVRLEPRNTESRLMLVRWHMDKGDPDSASSLLAEGLVLEKQNAAWRETHILLLRNLGRYEEAIASVDDAIQVAANEPRWPQLKGLVYQTRGDMANAAEAYRLSWLARKTVISGKATAEAALAKAPPDFALARQIVDDPEFHAHDDPYARLTKARLAVLESRKKDSIEDVRAALSMPAGPGKSGFDLREIRTSVMVSDELTRVFGGNEPAVAALEQITPPAGWPDAFRLNIARIKLYAPTLKDAGKAELEPISGTASEKEVRIAACSLLGNVAFQDGDIDKAVMYYQRGLEADKNNAEMLNNLAFVLGRDPKRLAEAMVFAERAIEQDPNNPNILDTIGNIQYFAGELEKAEKNLIRARTATSDPVTRFMPTLHLIEVYLKQEKREEADALFRELEESYRRDPRLPRMFAPDFERLKKLMKP